MNNVFEYHCLLCIFNYVRYHFMLYVFICFNYDFHTTYTHFYVSRFVLLGRVIILIFMPVSSALDRLSLQLLVALYVTLKFVVRYYLRQLQHTYTCTYFNYYDTTIEYCKDMFSVENYATHIEMCGSEVHLEVNDFTSTLQEMKMEIINSEQKVKCSTCSRYYHEKYINQHTCKVSIL
jgi:hypothetical protein